MKRPGYLNGYDGIHRARSLGNLGKPPKFPKPGPKPPKPGPGPGPGWYGPGPYPYGYPNYPLAPIVISEPETDNTADLLKLALALQLAQQSKDKSLIGALKNWWHG